jgi:acetolactate synthase-1/2/3 large subunit
VIVDRVGNDLEAVGALEELAREFAIGVAASRHRHNISDEHPSANSSIRAGNADVILVLEHSIPWIPALEKPHPDAWIAAVGQDVIASQIPLYEFRANLRVTADAGDFLRSLLEQLRSRRRGEDQHRRDARWASYERGAADRQEGRKEILAAEGPVITEEFAGAALNEVMDPDDILVWELAHIEHTARTKPGTLFDSGGSSLGWGIAAATGAAVIDRTRPVVCATGDGSYMFGSPDSVLWTQMRYDAPVLTIIYNNRGYRTGTTKLARDYPEGHGVKQIDTAGGTFDPPPDFAAHAEAVDCFGRKVLDKKELLDALKDAKRAVEVDRRPAVVDVWLPAHVTGKHPLRGNAPAADGS